jgi:hypothetical protein
MATTPGYDPKKAATFNQLRQGGLSEEAAAAQAGIPLGDGNYVISGKYNADGTKNPNPGTMGADVQGSAKVAGRDYDVVSAADQAENARFDRGLTSPSNFEKVDYQVDAKNSPSKVTPVNYTTTSTETVSGGGSTTVTAGVKVPNAASQSLQPAIDAKQAEINQFQKDNPSDFIRKRQGLPPLSQEESDQREAKLLELNKERGALKNQQLDAQTSTPPTITTVPNTTTTTETVTSGITNTNQEVDPLADQQLSQQNEITLGVAVGASNVQTAPGAVDNNESVSTPQPAEVTESVFDPANVDPNSDPFEQARFEAEQAADVPPNEIVLTPDEQAAADDPFEQRRLELEQQANRDELAREENLNVGDSDPVAFPPSPDFAANPDE